MPATRAELVALLRECRKEGVLTSYTIRRIDAALAEPDHVDAVLERFDQTDPALQRQIVAEFVARLVKAEDERDALVDGIKHANAILAGTADEIDQEQIQEVKYHLLGCISGESKD